MSTPSITPVTVVAMRKVFALLEDHFDPVEGMYKNAYSDKKVAAETGISVDAVKKYRVDGFGKLKAPSELVTLRQQIDELETLFLKTEAEMKAQIKDTRARILQLQRGFD
jgi:hypothetical protein